MDILVGVVLYIVGAGGMFLFSVWINPYLRARLLSICLGRSYGVAEEAANNAEILLKVIKTADKTVKFGENEHILNKTMFMRKLGVPVQHFAHDSIKPSPWRSADIIKTEYVIPGKVNLSVEFDYKASPEEIKKSKGEPFRVKKELILTWEQLTPLGSDWIEAPFKPAEIKTFSPVFLPPQLAAFMEAEHAYSITNATIQKQKTIEQAKEFAFFGMLISAATFIVGLGCLYFLMNLSTKLDGQAQILAQLNATINANTTKIIGPGGI